MFSFNIKARFLFYNDNFIFFIAEGSAVAPKIVRPPSREKNYGFVTPPEFKYHNYKELEKKLMLLNKSYPNITNLYSVGQSVQGRELYVLEISDKPGEHEPGKLLIFLLIKFARSQQPGNPFTEKVINV